MNNEENVSIADLRAFLAEFSAEWAVKMKEFREERAEAAKRSEADFQKMREERAEAAKRSEADFQKMREAQAEAAKRSEADFQKMREAQAEAAKRSEVDFQKIREAQAKTDKLIGGISYNQGKFAEEYFFNSFDRGKQNFFGEKFDSIKQNLKGTETEDEFDIVMLNGGAVGIIEVKFKAHKNDIPDVLKKVATFRDNFPKYKNHKAYIGIATMAFYPELEQECENQGIAIVKQVGDTVVINDKHLKVF